MLRIHGRAIAAVVLVALSAGGCADITSVSRRTDLGDGAKAIHLDAKQRLVMTWDHGSYYCAEPNPDALATVASSLGGGVSVSGEGAGSIASALSENAGSIGLRTQSITLLRDAMYRICEAGYNQQIGPSEIAQLHARMQNLMVGLLAIEQLTGAVAAKQVILSGDAKARSSAAVLDTDAARQAADQRVKQAEARVKRAETQLNTSRTTAETAQTTFVGPPCNGNLPADTDANHSVCKDQQQNVTDTADRVKSDEAELDDAKVELRNAQDQRNVIQANHDAAMTEASATASGKGQFSEPTPSNLRVDAMTAKHVATAVSDIVNTIVLTNESLDLCAPFISALAPRDKADGDGAKTTRVTLANLADPKNKAALEFCAQALKHQRELASQLALKRDGDTPAATPSPAPAGTQ